MAKPRRPIATGSPRNDRTPLSGSRKYNPKRKHGRGIHTKYQFQKISEFIRSGFDTWGPRSADLSLVRIW